MTHGQEILRVYIMLVSAIYERDNERFIERLIQIIMYE